jgi:hypothetical protein
LLLLFVAFAATPPWKPPSIKPGSQGDIATYQQIVSRIRSGGSYYDVVGAELRRTGYATREIFNWRTPLLWSALGAVPDLVGRVTLVALAGLLFIGTLSTTSHEPVPVALSDLMQTGTVVVALAPGVVTMGESWAGILIALSAIAYGRQRYVGGAVLGIVALFIRELAAPFCVVCTLAALSRRRWREFSTWVVGAVLYSTYYAWHFVNVQAHRLPTDRAHASSWLEIGGLPSLLSKAAWEGWLLLAPHWVVALALALVCAGIAAAGTPVHVRLASAAYVVFFCVAGKPFDHYWGLVAWPVWSLACGYGLQFVFETWSAATAKPTPVGIEMSR